MLLSRIVSPLLVAAAALCLLGKGESGALAQEIGSHHDHVVMSAPFGRAGQAAEVRRTVEITVREMTFLPDQLEVKQGEVVRFVIRNLSAIDHDFTLGDAATQIAHRQEMAQAMAAGQPMHHHTKPYALTVKAGTSGELIWAFSQPGRFEYDCNVPGHYDAGMKGVVTVVP